MLNNKIEVFFSFKPISSVSQISARLTTAIWRFSFHFRSLTPHDNLHSTVCINTVKNIYPQTPLYFIVVCFKLCSPNFVFRFCFFPRGRVHFPVVFQTTLDCVLRQLVALGAESALESLLDCTLLFSAEKQRIQQSRGPICDPGSGSGFSNLSYPKIDYS